VADTPISREAVDAAARALVAPVIFDRMSTLGQHNARERAIAVLNAAAPLIVAAALRTLADEHQRMTDEDRCCGPLPEPQCLTCGQNAPDETTLWLRAKADEITAATE
jgi:hypothetical protein